MYMFVGFGFYWGYLFYDSPSKQNSQQNSKQNSKKNCLADCSAATRFLGFKVV